MNYYKVLRQQVYSVDIYRIVPIQYEDRFDIMKWRNEQMYHLRQSKLLSKQEQDNYFTNVVSKLYEQEQPNQILFSYLENDVCIGYGGLVHINWIDKHAEVSFIINTELEKDFFEKHWTIYLKLIEKVSFENLKLHKIFTFAFDLRPHLYQILEKCGFNKEAVLKDHCFFNGEYKNALIHSKINSIIDFRNATEMDEGITFRWAINPLIRKFSFSKKEISLDEHAAWFKEKIKDANCSYYIAKIKDAVIGSIRFDIKDDEALISYLLDANYHGKGFGVKLLSQGIDFFLKENNVKHVCGLVFKENIPSMKAFRELGYKEIEVDETTVKFIKNTQ